MGPGLGLPSRGLLVHAMPGSLKSLSLHFLAGLASLQARCFACAGTRSSQPPRYLPQHHQHPAASAGHRQACRTACRRACPGLRQPPKSVPLPSICHGSHGHSCSAHACRLGPSWAASSACLKLLLLICERRGHHQALLCLHCVWYTCLLLVVSGRARSRQVQLPAQSRHMSTCPA